MTPVRTAEQTLSLKRPGLALLLFLAVRCKGSVFLAPDIQVCGSGDCSTPCETIASGDSCSEAAFGLYASATCSDGGSLSFKLCDDDSCGPAGRCEAIPSSSGCAGVDLFFTKLSVRASCKLTSLSIFLIVACALVVLCCLGWCCCCECKCCEDDSSAVTRAYQSSEDWFSLRQVPGGTRGAGEETPLVSRSEAERLNTRLLESKRQLAELTRRVNDMGNRQARDALLGNDKPRSTRAASRRGDNSQEDAYIPSWPQGTRKQDELPDFQSYIPDCAESEGAELAEPPGFRADGSEDPNNTAGAPLSFVRSYTTTAADAADGGSI